jgi:hypothetical protein
MRHECGSDDDEEKEEECMLHINVAGTRFTFRTRQLIAANVGLLSQLAKHTHAQQSYVANDYIAEIYF